MTSGSLILAPHPPDEFAPMLRGDLSIAHQLLEFAADEFRRYALLVAVLFRIKLETMVTSRAVEVKKHLWRRAISDRKASLHR